MFRRLALFCLLLLTGLAAAAERIIVIDAGHGGAKPSGTQAARTLSSDNNATSPGGLKEKDLTLELAQKVIALLNASPEARKAGIRAIPTRTTDVNPDFAQRAKIAADAKATWFVSLHFNASAGARKTNGTLALVPMKRQNPHYKEDAAFASSLIAATAGALRPWLPQAKPLPVGDDRELHGGQGSNLFFQLRAQCPAPITACFLEVEFMDNPAVEQAILTKHRTAAFDATAAALVSSILSAAAPQP